MSFAYMPFYTGDYYRDTRHLSMLQHGAYRQLLDHCWDQKGPLPLDVEKCYRICGAVSKEEQEAVRGIVSEFFICMDDGHYNKRMAEEVAKAERLSQALSQAGLRSAESRRNKARKGARAKAEATLNPGLTKVEPRSVSPSPSPSPYSPPVPSGLTGKARKARPHPPKPEQVSEQVWEDWLDLRKKRDAPVTATVVAGATAEALKAGMTLEEFLAVWCLRGSQGLQASWLKPDERGKSFRERDANAAAAEVAKWTGGRMGAKPEVIDMEEPHARLKDG